MISSKSNVSIQTIISLVSLTVLIIVIISVSSWYIFYKLKKNEEEFLDREEAEKQELVDKAVEDTKKNMESNSTSFWDAFGLFS